MKLNELVESRLAVMEAERNRLASAWNPLISATEKYLLKERKTGLTDQDKRNIARCCENAILESGMKGRSKIFETTDSSNISFLGVQLPVIAALLPSLVLNKISVVQALDRRTGGVFYLDVKYGASKGATVAATNMMSATVGHDSTLSGRRYASQRVQTEAQTTTQTAGKGANERTGTLAYVPCIAGSVVITDGTETFTDNGLGVLVSTDSSTEGGTINYTTGVYTLIFPTATIGTITATYKYSWETKVTDNVPTVDIAVRQETITAEDFPLRANYTLGAAIDLEKAHGLNLEDEIIKYLGGEVKFTIDHLGIDLMNDAAASSGAATTAGAFSATVGTGQEWIWKKYQFLDFVEKANVNIINKTLRAACNFLIVGNDTARLIRQLEPHFKPAAGLDSMTPTGPYELGTLDGRIVIHDPLMTAANITFGYKGDSYIMAGFVMAPYIPLFSTPTLITADLKAQKGFLASVGYKVTNAGFFCNGTISGLS